MILLNPMSGKNWFFSYDRKCYQPIKLQYCLIINISGRNRPISFHGVQKWNIGLKQINPLSANITKWSNTLKQFGSNLPTNCSNVFDHCVILVLKGLRSFGNVSYFTVPKLCRNAEYAQKSLNRGNKRNFIIFFQPNQIWNPESIIFRGVFKALLDICDGGCFAK